MGVSRITTSAGDTPNVTNTIGRRASDGSIDVPIPIRPSVASLAAAINLKCELEPGVAKSSQKLFELSRSQPWPQRSTLNASRSQESLNPYSTFLNPSRSQESMNPNRSQEVLNPHS